MASGLRVVLIGCSVTGKRGSSTLFIGGKPVLPESWAKRTGSGSRLGYPALEVAVLQSGPPPVGAEVRERRRRVRGLSVAMVAAQGFPEVLMCIQRGATGLRICKRAEVGRQAGLVFWNPGWPGLGGQRPRGCSSRRGRGAVEVPQGGRGDGT